MPRKLAAPVRAAEEHRLPLDGHFVWLARRAQNVAADRTNSLLLGGSAIASRKLGQARGRIRRGGLGVLLAFLRSVLPLLDGFFLTNGYVSMGNLCRFCRF